MSTDSRFDRLRSGRRKTATSVYDGEKVGGGGGGRSVGLGAERMPSGGKDRQNNVMAGGGEKKNTSTKIVNDRNDEYGQRKNELPGVSANPYRRNTLQR